MDNNFANSHTDGHCYYVNSVKGHAGLQLSRDLDCQYKTAFVLSHKIREALAGEQGETVSGTVSVDGAYFDGYVKPSNYKENRRDRRLAKNQNGKRKVAVVAREKGGRTVTKVFNSEAAGVAEIASVIELVQPFTPTKPRIGTRSTIAF